MVGTYIAWFIVYLLFQVGIGTMWRLMDMGSLFPLFLTRERYIKILIPGVGILIALYYIFSVAFRKD